MTAEVHFATDTYVVAAIATVIAAIVTMAAMFVRWSKKQLLEIVKATKANGLDTDSTGDTSKRTENKVDALTTKVDHLTVNVSEVKATLKLHAAVLDALVDGDDESS